MIVKIQNVGQSQFFPLFLLSFTQVENTKAMDSSLFNFYVLLNRSSRMGSCTHPRSVSYSVPSVIYCVSGKKVKWRG